MSSSTEPAAASEPTKSASFANTTSLKVSNRAYLFMRSMSIQTPLDALIEMVTNSDDAYQDKKLRLAAAGQAFTSRARGDIEVVFKQPYSIVVRDHATGMSGDQMMTNLLTVGDYTASSTSARGYFSRGAKDISALGDVTFMSIKDNLFSKCVIKYDMTTEMIVSDVPATDAHHAETGIDAGQNGFYVCLDVRPEHTLITSIETYRALKLHVSVRGIFSDPELNIVSRSLLPSGKEAFSERIVYIDVKGKMTLRKTFVVPGYPPEAVCTFTMYQSDQPIPEVTNDKLQQFGFVIACGPRANLAMNWVNSDIRSNDGMRYTYGRIETTYIRQLLVKFDSGDIDKTNPFTIIDPSRQSGVNVNHPFMSAIMAIITPDIRLQLNNISDKTAGNVVQSGSLRSLINNLSIGGKKVFITEGQALMWKQERDGPLLRAINNQRKSYVIAEQRDVSCYTLDNEQVPSEKGPLVTVFDKSKPTEGYTLDVISEGNLAKDDPLSDPARLLVKAYEKDTDFKIEFSDKESPLYRYSTTVEGGDLVLRIFLNDPFVQKFVTKNKNTQEIERLAEPNTIMAISSIVTEALAREIVKVKYSKNRDTFVTMTDGNVFHSVFKAYEIAIESIQIMVHETMAKFLEDGRLDKDESFVF